MGEQVDGVKAHRLEPAVVVVVVLKAPPVARLAVWLVCFVGQVMGFVEQPGIVAIKGCNEQ